LNRSATNIPSACRIANIALNDAMILSYDANLGRMEFSERTVVDWNTFTCARQFGLGSQRTIIDILGVVATKRGSAMPRYYFHLTDGKQVLDNTKALICRAMPPLAPTRSRWHATSNRARSCRAGTGLVGSLSSWTSTDTRSMKYRSRMFEQITLARLRSARRAIPLPRPAEC